MLRMRSDALRNMKSLDKAIKREDMMGITRKPEIEDKMEKEGKELSEHTKTRNMSRAGVEEQIRGRRDDKIKATGSVRLSSTVRSSLKENYSGTLSVTGRPMC